MAATGDLSIASSTGDVYMRTDSGDVSIAANGGYVQYANGGHMSIVAHTTAATGRNLQLMTTSSGTQSGDLSISTAGTGNGGFMWIQTADHSVSDNGANIVIRAGIANGLTG